jgi:DNA-binding response OmpR family regulator
MARILVIDDDPLVRKTVDIILAAHGFEVVTAADGLSGVEVAKSGAFDLVIVDLFMPGMDGLQTTTAIRRHCPTVPVITASGFMLGESCPRMPNFDAMASEAGAVMTLYKPFRPAELLGAVRSALRVAV